MNLSEREEEGNDRVGLKVDKEHILKEIDRTAKENNGIPLGRLKFEKETGIKYSDWFGRFWAKWNDALTEAGYPPNKMQSAYDESFLIDKVISLAREIKKIPTAGEFRLKAHNSVDFPNEKTIYGRFGGMAGLANRILSYCESKPEYLDIVDIYKKNLATLKKTPNIINKNLALSLVMCI